MRPATISCQAILFDFDGVLVDSNPIAERHWVCWARRHGIDEEHVLSIHHGRPTVETIRAVAPHLDAASEARVKETAEADDTDGLSRYPGAMELLARLPADRWGIATSGTRRTALHRLRHVGLPEPAVLVTADDVRRGKPDPEPYRLAAMGVGWPPADCLVIEDAPAGIRSARSAGARVVAVASTNAPPALRLADVIVPALAGIAVEVLDSGQLRVTLPNPVDHPA